MPSWVLVLVSHTSRAMAFSFHSQGHLDSTCWSHIPASNAFSPTILLRGTCQISFTHTQLAVRKGTSIPRHWVALPGDTWLDHLI